jgi:hypothetical protein
MTAYSFSQLIDFTRTSPGTFVGSNGLIQNSPQSRNLLTFTQEFDNAAWVKINSTVTANSVTAPDGTMTADTLTAVSANGTALQTYTAINAPYMYSVWLRRLTGTGDVQITVDGTTYATVAVTTTWTRFNTVLLGLAGAAGSRTAGVRIVTSGDAVYVWGAQLEVIPDVNLTFGSELISSGVIGLVGTPPAPATYNTGTGVGSVARTDLGNQSFVQWTGLSGTYRVNLTATTGSPTVRVGSGGPSGNIVLSVATGTTQNVYAQATDGFLTLASVNLATPTNPSTATFTLNSLRQITGTVGMPTTYTRNFGGLFPPRFDYNPITLAPLGILIEEQRANLLFPSEDFSALAWSPSSTITTTNTTVAPDGTTTGDTVRADASTSAYVSRNASFTGNGDKSFSVFLKAGTSTVTRLVLRDITPTPVNRAAVDITWTAGVPSGVATTGTLQGIDPYSNGWYRIRMLATGVIAGNTNQFRFSPDTATGTGTTIFWGAQTEDGAFATSYIPTVDLQITRAPDRASINAPMFSPWFNASAGTFVSSFDVIGSATATARRHVWCGSDALDRRLALRAIEPGTGAPLAAIGTGITTVSLNGTALTVGTPTDIAVAYGADMALVQNGASPAASALASSVSISSLDIGCNLAATQFLNGHIRSIDFYPVRLSDTQLQALTV